MGERPAGILVWGISGAGKSQYCKWLANRGYVYIDNDTAGQGRRWKCDRVEHHWIALSCS